MIDYGSRAAEDAYQSGFHDAISNTPPGATLVGGADLDLQERYKAGYEDGTQQRYARIPAVARDNDPEDTIARFDGLHVSIPPFPGYQSRKTVEEQYDPADERAANGATVRAIWFVVGVIVGSVLSLLSP